MTELHWLFKPMPDGVACLGIEIFPDGDYWVYDSPSGTYAAGHADKGKWRKVADSAQRRARRRFALWLSTALLLLAGLLFAILSK